ncbi:hypothetical protein [Pseudomonas sp.]|nr:hypothetical protein [Pseudomonas sp.]HUE94638.1 hypothetical protein [Pseudomonas sp.]
MTNPRYHRGQPSLQGINHLLITQDAGVAQRAQLHAASHFASSWRAAVAN